MTKKPVAVLACAAAALVLAGPLKARSGRPAAELPFPLIERFEHFGPEQGLPAWKVHCVLADKGKVWVGTTKGLAVLEGKTFNVIGPGQGLSHSWSRRSPSTRRRGTSGSGLCGASTGSAPERSRPS